MAALAENLLAVTRRRTEAKETTRSIISATNGGPTHIDWVVDGPTTVTVRWTREGAEMRVPGTFSRQ